MQHCENKRYSSGILNPTNLLTHYATAMPSISTFILRDQNKYNKVYTFQRCKPDLCQEQIRDFYVKINNTTKTVNFTRPRFFRQDQGNTISKPKDLGGLFTHHQI